MDLLFGLGSLLPNRLTYSKGGLFSGAEKTKSMADRALYGGLADTAYDPCYHQACDTFLNIDNVTLKEPLLAFFPILFFSSSSDFFLSWFGLLGRFQIALACLIPSFQHFLCFVGLN